MFPLLLAITLHINTTRVLARFDPAIALGATIDVHEPADYAESFSKKNVARMRSAGFHPLSYRLATELDGEAWHWNPNGKWSGANEGYWTSSSAIAAPITRSYGYRLPRRGNTHDQSRNDDYSRIDDGDPATFWKSNPYLHPAPQWLLIDLGRESRVDRIAIDWGEPKPSDYESQYWVGRDALNEPDEGHWVKLNAPVSARFLRVVMRCGSLPDSRDDWRNHAGVAVREVRVFDGAHDLVHHEKSNAQTTIWVSSTDPWHRAADIDRNMLQPGIDTVFASGLTNQLPMLTPIALLYGTPEDAAAEIRYLRARRYAVTQIEMGEEPDGQTMSPEDYAALYMRFAKAIHEVDSTMQLGGPAFQSTRDGIAFWPDERGRTSWMGRFVSVVPRKDFNFFSFEWYPFDDVCASPSAQLAEAPAILDRVLGGWKREGVPQNIPWIASEYGWSSYAAEAEVDVAGALFNAELVADFLARGGNAAYFYGYEPSDLFSEKCDQYGALTLFVGDENVPAYYAARMVTKNWLAASGVHELFGVDAPTGVRAYAVKRPDGSWSMLAIDIGATVQQIAIAHRGAIQYSQRDYVWKAAKERGHATRNVPPHAIAAGGSIELPPMSMTVIALGN